MRSLRWALGLLLALPVAALASDACPEDVELTVRNGHAMAFDERLGAVVLFGGADERRVLADLWTWTGTEWRCLAAHGPPPRTFPALAWDGAGERLVLFGGNAVLFGSPGGGGETFLDDMWEWDGRRWQEISSRAPGPRAEAGAAWDSRRRRVVMFGGYRQERTGRLRLGDTWEWDGERWALVSETGPAARNGAALAYDPVLGVTVLFGGNGPAADTWKWDGRRWSEIPGSATDGRFNPAMAYDPAARGLIRFGGWTGAGRAADTWRFDGRAWVRIAREGPAARNHTAMALDRRSGVVVLFGGHDGERVFGDTWEWRGGAWSRAKDRPPRRRLDNGH